MYNTTGAELAEAVQDRLLELGLLGPVDAGAEKPGNAAAKVRVQCEECVDDS